jgi:hypothetical protein
MAAAAITTRSATPRIALMIRRIGRGDVFRGAAFGRLGSANGSVAADVL